MQMYLLGPEFFILSAMAYDRYVAICNPLLYNMIMSQRVCHVLVGIPYLYSTFQALLFTKIAVRQVVIGCVGLKHKQLAEKCLLVMYTYWERQPWEHNNYERVYTLNERSKKRQRQSPNSSFILYYINWLLDTIQKL
ncbi:olfactory receptor 8K5-like protein [Cricetulus griseus]|nr:olfactory receptor 8K5-like protein [Cricetulus griseus]